jgi:hypothetical protein
MMKLLLFRTGFAVLLVFLSSIPARASVTLNSTNFPDANFRAALSAITGVAEGGSINEATLTELDVSNQGITNLTGVEKLTSLTKLVAAHNSITHVRLTGNVHLEWLDLSYNPALVGFSSSTATASNHFINLTPSSTPMPLTHLDLSNCNIGYFQAISNTYGVTTLTWLSLANDTPMAGWSSGITAQTGLVYCDLTNTGQTSTSIGFTSNHNKLETLILSNNSSFGYSSCFQYLSALKFLDISNCDIYFREGTSSNYYLLHYLTPSNNPNLETLLVNNSALGSQTEGLTGFIHLKTVNIAGNSGATNFWVNGSPLLESLNITGCSGLAHLDLEQDALPRQDFTLITGSNTSLVTVSLNHNNYGSVGDAMGDLSGLTALQNLYLEDNSGFTNSDYTLSASDCGNLHGLDLGVNDFKSFTASSLPSTLTTLLLGNCPTLESVEIHNAPGLTKLGNVNGLGSSTGEGLYLLGDPLLTHLDLGEIHSPFNVTATNAMSQIPTLNYLDLSATGQSQSSSLGLTSSHTNLETLILHGNSSFGWSASLAHLSGLKYLDVSGCDLYFREGTSPNYYLLHYLTPTNNPNLETLIASNSNMGSHTEGVEGFHKLKTVDIKNNSGATHFWVNDCPLLETLDISNNTSMNYLKLENDGLPRNNFTLIGAEYCQALNSLYLNDNNYGSVGEATGDFSSLSHLEFLYLEHNSGFTGGPLTMSAADCGTLHGLDLGNNGFTSFSAESLPLTLTALMLGNNPSMKRLEMHNNPGITTMTSNPTMSDGSGLYLLGNTALTYMDISGTAEQPNYFQRIGNNSSLNGVPIDTIKACYNKFYTFRNLTEVPGDVYEHFGWKEYYTSTDYNLINKYSVDHDEDTQKAWRYKAYWPTMPAMPDSASLEQLPNLKYLDLSHCQLKDSVYLHKNTELRYLDVSHNRKIARYTTSQDKGKAYRQSIPANSTYNHSFEDYKKYLWLFDTQKKYPDRKEAYDQEYYTLDYNDTTGLYILDLLDNNKLEYLDISYTGIEQTALSHVHVSNARYIWIQDLPMLKYFYANYNGMRSMGIGSKNGKKREGPTTGTNGLVSLERLSVIGMRGADVTTMQGSINFLSTSTCTKLHYVNLSYSDFDSIGFYAKQLDTLIITGNPIHYINVQSVDSITYIDATACAFKQRGYDPETGNTVAIPATIRQREDGKNTYRTITMNGARVGGVYTGAVTTPWSGLRGVRAYNRKKLSTVLLDNCNGLREVYCHHDPKLPKIHGFENLAYNKDLDATFGYPTVDADSLDLVWVNDNAIFNELNLTQNDHLRYLHAYNDKALGDALGSDGMDLKENVNLVTAWVSNSNLQQFKNCDAISQANQIHLDTLKIWQNPVLDHLDMDKHPNLRYLDLRNCMVRNLDMSANSHLTYFDCSNMDSISASWTAFDNYGFTMPRQVPTSMSEPGKNSIADLNFSSKALRVVHADNNDLYSLKGLNDNSNLNTLTYSFNHISGIDLSGCPSISTYNCAHNVRGLIPGELSVWYTTENGVRTMHEMYYFQLEENAGDALPSMPAGYNTFLGSKDGQDSIETASSTPPYMRNLTNDGFDPTKVIRFTVNASGPYVGTRGRDNSTPSGAPSRVTVDPSDDLQLDLSTIYGTVAVIKYMDPERNYIEYLYDDGRPSTSKAGGGSGFGLAWGPPGIPTSIDETTANGLEELTVVSERYYDAAGIEHSEPVNGLTIIVRQMSDGSTQTEKIMKH